MIFITAIFLLELFLGLLLIQNKKDKIQLNLYFVLSFIIFFLFEALRSPDVGSDLQDYIDYFISINFSNLDFSLFQSRFEFGYTACTILIRSITDSVQLFIAIIAGIVLLPFYHFIHKYSNFSWVCVLYFLAIGFYSLSMGPIRQMIAIGVLLFSYQYVEKHDIYKFLLLVGIAMSFHVSAVCFLLVYPLSYCEINKRFVMCVSTAAISCFICLPLIINETIKYIPKYAYYLNGEYMEGSIKLAAIKTFILIFLSVMLCYKTGYWNKSVTNNNFTLLLIVALFFSFLTLKYTILARFINIFWVYAIVALPESISFLRDKWLRLIMNVTVLLILLSDQIVIELIRPEWNGLQFYNFFW